MMRPDQKIAFQTEEVKWIIARLEDVQRNPKATPEEIEIATQMLCHYKQFRWC